MENAVNEAFALAESAASVIRAAFPAEHEVLVVLGSGWAESVPALEAMSSTPVLTLDVADIPGFKKPTALGHGGALKSIRIGTTPVLLLTGRTHLYEGRGVHAVVHGVRTAFALGCRTVVLTNGAGCLRTDWNVGTPVVIRDHINLTAHSPLTGDNAPAPLAGRFVDLTDAYNESLRALVRSVEPGINEAVYLGLHGPHFETPAEIRMAATWGAEMVGMSTVLETIAARHLDMNVLALSLATNLASGLSGNKLSGEEVIQVGKDSSKKVGDLLGRVLVAFDQQKGKLNV
jgi:purine-nucleoside phosphorylase